MSSLRLFLSLFDESFEDIHKHKCSDCGKVWEHDGAKLQRQSVAVYDAAHSCCGIVHRDRVREEKTNEH